MNIPDSFGDSVRVIDLEKIPDARGALTFVEGGNHIPFDIKRVYYLYDVPGGEERGGHAHYDLQQLIVAVSGSFDVHVDNGIDRAVISCNQPFRGILMKSMIWRELKNFSSGSVCLVLASNVYLESDYIRSYDQFLKVTREKT